MDDLESQTGKTQYAIGKVFEWALRSTHLKASVNAVDEKSGCIFIQVPKRVPEGEDSGYDFLEKMLTDAGIKFTRYYT